MNTSRWLFIPILAAAYFLVTGNGILAVLIPYRAHAEGISAQHIAQFGSGYFAGMLGGAFIIPLLIHRFGAMRAFAFAVSLGALAAFCLPLMIAPLPWILCRTIIGFSLASLYSVLESWLNASAAGGSRAKMLAMGRTVQYAAWASGSQIFAHGNPATPWLFWLAAGLIFLAAMTVFANRLDEPPRPSAPKLDLLWFLKAAPLAFCCAALIGLSSGAFWSLNPVYGSQIHLDAESIGNIGTAVTLGAALAQVPVGHWSDSGDRRKVLLTLALMAALGNAMLAYFGPDTAPVLLYLHYFLLGAIMMPLYYVVSAYSVDHCGTGHAVMVTAAILFLYCIGAIIGPMAASALMGLFGPGALYIWVTGAHLIISGLTLRDFVHNKSIAAIGLSRSTGNL